MPRLHVERTPLEFTGIRYKTARSRPLHSGEYPSVKARVVDAISYVIHACSCSPHTRTRTRTPTRFWLCRGKTQLFVGTMNQTDATRRGLSAAPVLRVRKPCTMAPFPRRKIMARWKIQVRFCLVCFFFFSSRHPDVHISREVSFGAHKRSPFRISLSKVLIRRLCISKRRKIYILEKKPNETEKNVFEFKAFDFFF